MHGLIIAAIERRAEDGNEPTNPTPHSAPCEGSEHLVRRPC